MNRPTFEEMTSEQEKKLAEISEKWRRIAISTGPADREFVNYCIKFAYHRGNTNPSKEGVPILWCQSPLSLSLTAGFLKLFSDNINKLLLTGDFWCRVREVAGEGVFEDIRSAINILPYTDYTARGVDEAFELVTGNGSNNRVPVKGGWTIGSPTLKSIYEFEYKSGTWHEHYMDRGIDEHLVKKISVKMGLSHPAAPPLQLASFSAGARISQCVRQVINGLDEKWNANERSLQERERQAGTWALKREFEKEAACTELANNVRNALRLEDTHYNFRKDSWPDYLSHIALWDACEEMFGLCKQLPFRPGLSEEVLGPLAIIAEYAGFFCPYSYLCLVSEKPQVLSFDSAWRLHCSDGPAVRYPDDWSIYSYHGVAVPKEVILNPGAMTPAMIDREANIEVRRAMIDKFGAAEYLSQSKAQEIHRDDYGVLYLKPVRDDEPVVMVKVTNQTLKPDGSAKEYFIRVPPDIRRAKAAVAWSFGMTEQEYAPSIET